MRDGEPFNVGGRGQQLFTHSGGAMGSAEPRHSTVVVYRRRLKDGLRKSYWVRCWRCDLRDGPWWDEDQARDRSKELFGLMQSDRPLCGEMPA